MPTSLSHKKELDVGYIGIAHQQLPDAKKGFLDLNGWFDDESANRPLELEIGSGKGTFLVGQAQKNRHINYIGLEWAASYWRHAADRCRRLGLENVRLLRGEAVSFVSQYVADNTFSQVHIYFPDPWPKKRHNKRRTFQENFLRQLHRVLVPGGAINVATDHQDYFAWMEIHAQRVTDLFRPGQFQVPDSADEGELVGTNFERKYRKQGRDFNAMTLRAV